MGTSDRKKIFSVLRGYTVEKAILCFVLNLSVLFVYVSLLQLNQGTI